MLQIYRKFLNETTITTLKLCYFLICSYLTFLPKQATRRETVVVSLLVIAYLATRKKCHFLPSTLINLLAEEHLNERLAYCFQRIFVYVGHIVCHGMPRWAERA